MTELPVCRWRLQPVGVDRHVCISRRVRCNAAGIPDAQCLTCLHANHAPDPPPRRQCVHLGELRRVAPVRLAGRDDGAGVLARVYGCGVHGECTPNVEHGELACCNTCADHRDDWVRDAAGDVRHLTYFLYPAGPLWRWNVEQLLGRLSLFNGRRLVTVAWDQASAHPDEVAELFDGLDVELRFDANDPLRKEMVGHMAMVQELSAYRGPGDVTWYGHGKGSGSHIYGEGVRRWAAEMYAGTLDYWPAVRQVLRDHAAAGVYLRILSPHPGSTVPWHYSGSFRWIRNADLYRRAWRSHSPEWYGSEMYPARHVRLDEAACLWGEFAYGGVALYLEDTWREWAQAEADQWKAAHVADRWTPQLVTVLLTAHCQPARVHEAIRSVLSQTTSNWQLLVVSSGAIPDADLVGPYRDDARVQLLNTGEVGAAGRGGRGQAWAINEAWRRGRVRGELVVHLSDDDVLARSALGTWMRVAALHPEQSAWYGEADRVRVHAAGPVEDLGRLGLRGVLSPANPGLGHVDGMQVCHRRSARTAWPEERGLGAEADGHWMGALAERFPIQPVAHVVGVHRHTPESCFTR